MSIFTFSDMRDLKRSNASALPGGQLQRLALARATFHRREIILLDELTIGSDPFTEAKIIHPLSRMSNKYLIAKATHSRQAISNSRVCYNFKLVANHT